MEVLTLSPEKLSAKIKDLERTIANQGYCPDLVLGIATGGDAIAQEMFGDANHATITCRRPSTKNKDCNAAKILRHLPYCVSNVLRIIESKWLTEKDDKQREVRLSEDDASKIAHAKRVLIVDDAVDSGATLSAVLGWIYKIKDSKTQVRTAAIVSTIANPSVEVDYRIYDHGTLIRFPWSKDFRG